MFKVNDKDTRARGEGSKISGLKGGGAFPEGGGVKTSRWEGEVGFLDIIFHPFQILLLVSLNR